MTDDEFVRGRLADFARRWPEANATRALRCRPLPLIDERLQLGVLFSAKAGSTYVVRWFFTHVGLLEAAQAYGPWIHDYRIKVYYATESYRPEALLGRRTRIVKFVRGPYERAVSSYVHAVRFAYDDPSIQEFLGRPIDKGRRFSFREFVSYLESQSLDSLECDPHHRLQTHESERLGLLRPTHLVRVEDTHEAVPPLERELGLRATEHASLRHSRHHTKRGSAGATCMDRANWKGRDGRPRKHFPATHRFYDSELLARVHALYQSDFERYGYDPADVPRPSAP